MAKNVKRYSGVAKKRAVDRVVSRKFAVENSGRNGCEKEKVRERVRERCGSSESPDAKEAPDTGHTRRSTETPIRSAKVSARVRAGVRVIE